MENDGNGTAAQLATFREEGHGDHVADHHHRYAEYDRLGLHPPAFSSRIDFLFSAPQGAHGKEEHHKPDHTRQNTEE